MNPCWNLGSSFEDAAAEVGGVSESEVEPEVQVRLVVHSEYMYELVVVVFELIMLQILQRARCWSWVAQMISLVEQIEGWHLCVIVARWGSL